MHPHHKKKLKIFLPIAAVITVAALIACLIIYKFYPIAIVGGELVSVRQYEQSVIIAKRFDPTPDKQKVFQQLIESKQKEQLVGKLRVNKNNITAEEKDFYKTGNPEYGKFISDYFAGSEKKFETYVAAPEAYDAQLRIKHNSDFAANNDAYNKAGNVLTRLDNGEIFEEVAKAYSDDKVSGQLGGDLGFVTQNQILPELEKIILDSKTGEVKKEIIVSRLGYHILYPVETSEKDGQKVWHLKHILIQTTGYEEWVKDELTTIQVWKLFNI